MEIKGFSHIERPQIANYIKTVGKEISHAVKKSKKANLDNALKDVLYSLNEPTVEKQKSMLDFQPNEIVNVNNDKSRIKSVNYKMTCEDNKEPTDDINNLFNPFKKGNMNKTFYDRKKEELVRREKKLEIIKNKKRIEEEKNYKIKPKITKQSMKILETKLADKKPIYERTNEILNDKNQKIEKLKSMYTELKALEEEESIGSFKPPGQYNESRFIEWRKEREERERRKNEKIDRIKQEIEYLETETMKNMYKPSIDKKSEKIVKAKVSNEDINEPIYDKLYNLHNEKINKMNQISKKNLPSFAPTINSKLPNFIQSNLYNKITKNSSISMGLNSANKKLSSNSKHFLNSSMDLKNNNHPINYKLISNEYIGGPQSRNRINSSMTEIYNNPLHISEFDEDELEQVSRYRLASQESVEKVASLHKKAKFNPYNSFSDSIDGKNNIPWQKSIHYVNNEYSDKDETPNSLYKINVRNTSAWDKNRENQIMFDSRISRVLKSTVKINRTSSAKK